MRAVLRPRPELLLLLAVTGACGTPHDPLAAERAMLQQLEREATPDGPPHISVRAHGPTVDELVGALLVPEEPVPLAGVMGLELELQPVLGASSIAFSDGPDGSVHIALRAEGTADAGGGGLVVRGLEWITTVEGDLEIAPMGPAIGAQWVDVEQVRIQAAIRGLDPLTDGIASTFFAQWIEEEATRAFAAPTGLVALPGPLGVRALRLRSVDGDVRLDVWLAVHSGGAAPLPGPVDAEEWAAEVPAESALGALRALAAAGDPGRVTVEPVAVALEEGQIAVEVRAWRPTRKERYRAYRVSGRPEVRDGAVHWVDGALELVEKSKWKNGLRTCTGERRVRKLLDGEPRFELGGLQSGGVEAGLDALEWTEAGATATGHLTPPMASGR